MNFYSIDFVAELKYLSRNFFFVCVHWLFFLTEKDCEKACRKVIEGQMSVDIYIARLNFLGLPRSGKSSTLKRLIGEIVDIVSAKWTKELESTGVAERNQAFIRNVSKCFGFASKSQWSKSDLSGETAILNDFMQQVVKGMS